MRKYSFCDSTYDFCQFDEDDNCMYFKLNREDSGELRALVEVPKLKGRNEGMVNRIIVKSAHRYEFIHILAVLKTARWSEDTMPRGEYVLDIRRNDDRVEERIVYF